MAIVAGALIAADGGIASALVSSPALTRTSSGFLGTSDGWTDLKSDFTLDHAYRRAVDGNFAQIGELPPSATYFSFTLGLGFDREGTSDCAPLHTPLAEDAEPSADDTDFADARKTSGLIRASS